MSKLEFAVYWRPDLGTVVNGIELTYFNQPMRRLIDFETRELTDREFDRIARQLKKLQDRYSKAR